MNFKEKLAERKPLIGTVLALPSPEITEMLASMDLDWLWLDMEHSVIDAPTMQRMLQATHNKIPCLVRPPSHDEVWIKKILDAGADGLLVPMVNSANDAQHIVEMSKYPPQGNRGVGISRAHKYGLRFSEYMERANDEIAVILQAETTMALKNISEIAAVPGIDAVFIGPYDLSASLGKMGQLTNPEVKQAIQTIAEACKKAGVRLGIFAATADAVEPFIQQDFTLLAIGTDGLHMAQSARKILKALKQ